MLEDLLGDSSKMQEEISEALKKIVLTEDLDGIVITANGARQIEAISLPATLLTPEKKEQLEDQLIVLINRVLVSITKVEQEESAKIMQKMLPGLENLFGQ